VLLNKEADRTLLHMIFSPLPNSLGKR